jgi:hypothetical protein
MTRTDRFRVAYCTIASANYLPRVQVFLESLYAQQPHAEAFVLLCETEAVCRRIADETGFPFITPAAVCREYWIEMSFQYDVIEFNTALKPFLLEVLLDWGFDGAVYFDPDIAIYAPLDDIEEALSDHDVVLTPHACHPVPDDGCTPAMADYLRAGQFNLGFIGMAGSTNGRAMLRWWQEVCRDRCVFDPGYRLFVDQFWAAAFASFAERLCVFRHPGANVAYWNLFQRRLEEDKAAWRVDSGPLLFFHFSGLASEDLTRVSRYQNRVTATPGSPLHRLLTAYAEDVARQPWGCFRQETYSFGYFADGTTIEPELRRKYLTLSRLDKQRLGNPFEKQAEIRSIVMIVMKGAERSYLARVRYERYWRMLGLIWQEFRNKLRTRGPWATFKLVVRFLFRKITGLAK